MNDFELLQMAAKALGGVYEISRFGTPVVRYGPPGSNSFSVEEYGWRPLENDGDAFRLMVMLRMWEDCDDGICCVEKTEDHGGDVYAATRRAIVRGAAEFGKAKQKLEEQ